MAISSSNLERFVRAVYRRLILSRAAEAMGVGTSVAAGVALVLVPVLLWRGRGALTLSIVLLLVGAGTGLVGFFFRRPSVVEAAGEADRQLQLHDVLTTAWGLRSRPTLNEFERAVLAVAEGKCQESRASMVILGRFGGRAWGGIGLASALVLALGLLSLDPVQSRAGAGRGQDVRSGDRVADEREPSGPDRMASAGGRRSPTVREDPEGDGGRGETSTRVESGGDERSRETERRSDGAGVGRAESPEKMGDVRTPPRSASGRGSNAGGEVAGGAGGASANAGNGGASSGVASGANASKGTPAWESGSWDGARQRADEAVRSNRVPAEYHEIMRAYFER